LIWSHSTGTKVRDQGHRDQGQGPRSHGGFPSPNLEVRSSLIWSHSTSLSRFHSSRVNLSRLNSAMAVMRWLIHLGRTRAC
jgi:hypothetical protein